MDTGNNRVQKFDSSGNYISQFGTFGSGNGQFNMPLGIAIDPDGNIIVVDTHQHRVQKFDSTGTYLLQIGTVGTFGSDDGQFYFPVGVTTDAEDNIYVADQDNHRIQKFDADGTFMFKFGNGQGSDPDQFSFPFGIDMGSDGNLYIADTYNSRIQIVTLGPPIDTLETNAVTGADIVITSPTNTYLTCHDTSTTDALPADTGYTYALGLVDFCLHVVPGTTHTVTLTFVTDLTPSQVVARKYDAGSQAYAAIPGATISATTYGGDPALRLTYSIADGGALDADGTINGTIVDPVGLASPLSAGVVGVPSTGLGGPARRY